MNIVRGFLLTVLGTVLAVTLVTGQAAAVAHMTVLDGDFVHESIEEEGGYAIIATQVQGQVAANAPENASIGPIDPETIIEEAVTEEYVASQGEQNIDNTYAYLHGSSGELNISLSTEPIKENATAAVEAEVQNASIADLVESANVTLRDPVNASLLRRMSANQSSYRDAKADFRSAAREKALDRAVNETFQSASNDQLLALVIPDYDPSAYTEAEKERLVQDNEDAIRAALRQRIEAERGDEIDRRVDERMDAARMELTNQTGESPAENASIEIQSTVARGLTTDMTYAEYKANLSAAKGNLSAAVGNRTEARLDEQLPDRIYLVGGDAGRAPPPLQTARTVVQIFDILTLLIPIVVLLQLGLIYLVADEAGTTMAVTGGSAIAAGLPLYLLRGPISNLIADRLEPGPDAEPIAAALQEVMVGVVEQVLGVVGQVTLTTTVVGVVLIAIGLVVHFAMAAAGSDDADDVDDEPDDTAGSAPDAGDTTGDPSGPNRDADPLDDPTAGTGSAGDVDTDPLDDAVEESETEE